MNPTLQNMILKSRLPVGIHGSVTNTSKDANEKKRSSTQALFSAETPGKSLPSNNSNDAPPPVLQCVTLSSVPYFLQAVAVSPPPMTVTTPAAVPLTTASIKLFVPVSNL